MTAQRTTRHALRTVGQCGQANIDELAHTLSSGDLVAAHLPRSSIHPAPTNGTRPRRRVAVMPTWTRASQMIPSACSTRRARDAACASAQLRGGADFDPWRRRSRPADCVAVVLRPRKAPKRSRLRAAIFRSAKLSAARGLLERPLEIGHLAVHTEQSGAPALGRAYNGRRST